MRFLLAITAIAALTMSDADAQTTVHSTIWSRETNHNTIISNLRAYREQFTTTTTTTTKSTIKKAKPTMRSTTP